MIRVLLCLIMVVLADNLRAQSDMLTDAIQNYLEESSGLHDYDPVTVEWKMAGPVQASFNEGLNYLLEENPALAETNFNEALEKDSTLWQAYYYRSICRKQQEEYKPAIADMNRVISRLGPHYEALVELGKLYQLRKNAEEAEKYYAKAIKLDPAKARGYFQKGNLFFSQMKERETVKAFNRCLEIDSAWHDAQIRLGIMKISTSKDINAGLPYFNKVLTLDSLNHNALFLRSVVVYNRDKKQSILDLDRVIQRQPNALLPLYMRGMLFSEMEDYTRSFSDFRKVIDATAASDNSFKGKQSWLDKKIDIQNAGAYMLTRVYGLKDEDAEKMKKAYCQMILGKYAEGVTTIDGTSVAKSDPMCFYLKAVANEHDGKHREALGFYNHALVLDNDIPDAHKKRGIYEQEMNLWSNSVTDFNDVLRLNPDTYMVYKMRGTSYYHLNKFSLAIADYNYYLQRDSTDKECIGYRGMAHRQMGQHLEAALDFASSDNGHIIDFPRLKHLLDSMIARGDSAKAYQYNDKILKDVSFFTEGYVMRMKMLVLQNSWKTIGNEIHVAVRSSRTNSSKQDYSYLLTVQAMTYSNGHPDDAVAVLTQAIKVDSGNSLAYLERGKVYQTLGKKGKAEADFKKALSLGDKEADALLNELK